MKIELVKDTINKKDVDYLIQWLKSYPRLTQGTVVPEFEEKFANWQGRKHCVFLNSGSSANLLMLYCLRVLEKLKNNIVIVPAISWATTVSPAIQFGMKPIFCDADRSTLGINPKHLQELFELYHPSVLMLCHVLGLVCDMNKIMNLCKEYGVIVIEDNCESLGSTYFGKYAGNFGLMSSFSFYFGHHMSTIEGGAVCTDDKEISNTLKMIRAHGWDRNLDTESQQHYRKKHKVDDFKALYTFYYPGFNFRSTDLNAYIGLKQIDKLSNSCLARDINFKLYQNLIKNDFWKPSPINEALDFVSNFAYPLIHPNKNKIVKALLKNDIETRPLICGSMMKQPFIKNIPNCIRDEQCPFANDIVDQYGIYLPNHQLLEKKEIEFVCKIVNQEM